jgi:hypothetical protein
MTATFRLWAPRVLGVALCLFLGMFALDAFSEGKGWAALPDFVIHLLPALVLLAVVVASWRHPWIGGTTFLLLAVGYAMAAWSHPQWILVISGPLTFVGVLFLWAWWAEAHTHA